MTERIEIGTRQRTLSEAARLLASHDGDRARMQNAVGFSRFDGDFGHRLAETDEATWSPKMKRAAWYMLRKYRGQLAQNGLDFAQIPVPPDPATSPAPAAGLPSRPQTVGRVISLHDDRFSVNFPYQPELVGKVKAVPGREWDKDARRWTVPQTAASAEVLVDFATENGFTYGPGAQERLQELGQRGKEMAEASRALDKADLQIEGLGGELHPFQKAGVAYLLKAVNEQGGAILGDEMGLGKTVQALAFIRGKEIELGRPLRALIVVPNSVKRKWPREIAKWLKGRYTLTVQGTRPLALQDFNGRYLHDAVVINYDLLRYHAEKLCAAKFDVVVLDESHNVKTGAAQRTKAAMAIAESATYVVLMSGTAILNRPEELITQLKMIKRIGEFGGPSKFDRLFCRIWSPELKTVRLVELNRRMRASFYVGRAKKDVQPELPAMQRSHEPMELSNRAEYNLARDRFVAWLHSKNFDAEKIDRALRGEAMVQINTLKHLAAQGKLQAAINWIREFLDDSDRNGESSKLIVFAHHQDVQQGILKAFPSALRIVAQDSTQVRQANADRFQQDPHSRLIVCSLEAGSEGIDLTAASNVAFLELAWTPGRMDQAEGRCYGRVNDPHGASAWYLLAEQTIDEWMAELLDEKRKTTKATLEGEEAGAESMLTALLKRFAAQTEAEFDPDNPLADDPTVDEMGYSLLG